jgi:hypothetical protein
VVQKEHSKTPVVAQRGLYAAEGRFHSGAVGEPRRIERALGARDLGYRPSSADRPIWKNVFHVTKRADPKIAVGRDALQETNMGTDLLRSRRRGAGRQHQRTDQDAGSSSHSFVPQNAWGHICYRPARNTDRFCAV